MTDHPTGPAPTVRGEGGTTSRELRARMTVTLLDWDSAFFGVRIGRARVQHSEDLARLDAAAHELRLDCLYALLPQPAPPTLPAALQEAGFFLTDVSQVLAAPLASEHGDPSVPEPGTLEDAGALGDLLDLLVPWSRFAADPRFGADAAKAMYVRWAERAAVSDDELMAVTRSPDGRVDGLITVSASPTPRIGLLVSARRGGGSHLVAAAKRWAADRGGDRLETGTQARNALALAFYERHGFRTTSSTYVMHRWFTAAASSFAGPRS